MMSKCSLRVTLLLALLFTSDCLFPGDSCVANERPGVCKLLAECKPLVAEIHNAGTPMPSQLRRKLQGLACGFQSLEPLVCCAAPFTNINPDKETSYPGLTSATHGMGEGLSNEENWPTPDPHLTNPWGPSPNIPDRHNDQNIHETKNLDPSVSSNTDTDSLPDITRHRNLNLLPRNCGQFSDEFRIWGGNRTFLFEMPWMVLIVYNSERGIKLSCGGTLITDRYVLTAAHCVSFLGNRLTLSGVLLGEYDIKNDPDCERTEGELHCAPNVRNVSIEKVIAHPGYSPQNLYDDIALIKLAEPADFTLDNMKPICLPNTPELMGDTLVGKMGTVAGWGATEDGLQSSVLLKVDLPILSYKDCQDAYNGKPKIYNRQICAGGVEDKDSCGGDSGGPLMNTDRVRSGNLGVIQQGIVSYGPKRCGIGTYPGVYTRVSYFMDWILDNISE